MLWTPSTERETLNTHKPVVKVNKSFWICLLFVRRLWKFNTLSMFLDWPRHPYRPKTAPKSCVTVPYEGVGCCQGPEGNGVSPGEEDEGGPGPPDKERDKQSIPSKEGGNMEQEEEGKKSQAWQRGSSVHRVSNIKGPLSMYLNIIKLFMM